MNLCANCVLTTRDEEKIETDIAASMRALKLPYKRNEMCSMLEQFFF